MPGGVFEAGLVAEGAPAGKERGSRGPLEGTPQRQGAGVVPPGGGDDQDCGRTADSGGGAGRTRKRAFFHLEEPVCRNLSRICDTAVCEKFEGLTNFELFLVEAAERTQVVVVTYQMTGLTVSRTQKKHDVIWIHWVMAEMKKCHRDQFGMNGEIRNKRLYIRTGDAVRE